MPPTVDKMFTDIEAASVVLVYQITLPLSVFCIVEQKHWNALFS